MIFQRNKLAYVSGGELFLQDMIRDETTAISALGLSSLELIGMVQTPTNTAFVLNNHDIITQCLTTYEFTLTGDCNVISFSSIPTKTISTVIPVYVGNVLEDFWKNRPEIIDFQIFENSLNFLTAETSAFSAFVHHYDGHSFPVSSEPVLSQYWFTMPVGTLACSSIDYNIIPLRNHIGVDYQFGTRNYTRFNYEDGEISLIYEVDQLPFVVSDGPFVYPDYLENQPLSTVTFRHKTPSFSINNADQFYSNDSFQGAWLSGDHLSSVWIDLDGGLSDIVLSAGNVYEYAKVGYYRHISNSDLFQINQLLHFDYFSGGYYVSSSDFCSDE